jgi:hypothetical protein
VLSYPLCSALHEFLNLLFCCGRWVALSDRRAGFPSLPRPSASVPGPLAKADHLDFTSAPVATFSACPRTSVSAARLRDRSPTIRILRASAGTLHSCCDRRPRTPLHRHYRFRPSGLVAGAAAAVSHLSLSSRPRPKLPILLVRHVQLSPARRFVLAHSTQPHLTTPPVLESVTRPALSLSRRKQRNCSSLTSAKASPQHYSRRRIQRIPTTAKYSFHHNCASACD